MAEPKGEAFRVVHETDTERKISWLNPKAKHFASFTKPIPKGKFHG